MLRALYSFFLKLTTVYVCREEMCSLDHLDVLRAVQPALCSGSALGDLGDHAWGQGLNPG